LNKELLTRHANLELAIEQIQDEYDFEDYNDPDIRYSMIAAKEDEMLKEIDIVEDMLEAIIVLKGGIGELKL